MKNKLIKTYLDELIKEMQGFDMAIVRDAMSDAEEHIHTALADMRIANPDVVEDVALQKIIDQYGTPAEIATAYAEVERRTFPGLAHPKNQVSRSFLGRFFGVYSDTKAWGGLLFMLVSFITGIVYFTWVTVGLSLSISLSLFIFGIPIALFFLVSLRGIVLIEGRLVEALLGVRMPRRPLFTSQEGKWFQKLKDLLKDRHTWLDMLYMVLQLVLGTLYFLLFVILISLSFCGFAIPVVQLIFHYPVISFGDIAYFLPIGVMPFSVLAGFLLLTITMHLARGIGQLHGRYAKFILVGD